MEKADNEMYALVDEEFLAKFSNQHLNYMKKLYYSFYAGYCKRIKRKPLTSEDFFKNMHLRRLQLYQLCCPYCGTVSLCIHDKKESKTAGYNFCHSCGRTSTLKNIQKHLARFVRIKRMNRISIQAVAEHRPETEKWLDRRRRDGSPHGQRRPPHHRIPLELTERSYHHDGYPQPAHPLRPCGQ